mgnify:CR=1 FL=1
MVKDYLAIEVVPTNDGRTKVEVRAELDYEVLEYNAETDHSLLRVKLYSGRGHQIRVQMSSQLNAPIFGDFKYGDKEHGGNLALWAYELTFAHPTTKENMKFAVMPDMSNPAFAYFNDTIEKMIN